MSNVLIVANSSVQCQDLCNCTFAHCMHAWWPNPKSNVGNLKNVL